MNIQPSFINARSSTSYQFSRLRMQALRDAFVAKVSGGVSALKIFPLRGEDSKRKYLGVKYIRLHEIVGTLDQQSDFDHKFRPLNKQLLDRWVDTILNYESHGWSPILAHKIGNEYYVEDGHLEVSVARFTGMAFIEAVVWEYADDCHEVYDYQPKKHAEKSHECISVQ